MGQELIAVSQRDDSSFYNHILKQVGGSNVDPNSESD